MELGHLTGSTSLLSSRKASCRLASTSQTLAAYSSFSYSDLDRQPQAKAANITWTGNTEQQWGRRDQQSVQQTPLGEKEQAAELGKAEAKPLRINRDLLLYRARQLRQKAFRVPSFSDRLRCYQQAEAALHKCIQLEPTDARAYVTLGKILLQQRRYDEARKTYEDAIAVTGGQNEYIWQAWAILEAKAGKVAEARKYFNAAVLVNPEHAASWHGWGMLEKREGNLVAARDLWVKGIRKTKGQPNPHLYQSLAVMAGEMGFVDEARAWFKQATATVRGAQSHALWHAWALLEERSGEPRVVRYLYKKGLEINPRSRYVHLAWAMFEKCEGEINNARQLLERGHMFNPKDAAILQALAVLEEEEGNIEDARQLFQRAADLDSRMVHVWQAWAMLELREGNFRRARQLFQSAVWTHPSNTDICKVWQAWAVMEGRAGNLGLARSMHNCAIKADPSSDKAWDSWLMMEESLGEERRVIMIQKARAAGRTEINLPVSFVRPEEMEGTTEAGMLEAVRNTVSEWLRSFNGKRSIVRRRLPSYLRPPTEVADPALLEQQSDDLPAIDEMMQLDSSTLDLPEVPGRFYPGKAQLKSSLSGGLGGQQHMSEKFLN